MSGHWPQSISLAAASDYFFVLVDSGQKTGIKRGFRVLRDTAQGSALRTRSLLKKAGENFISPAGGMKSLTLSPVRDKVTDLPQTHSKRFYNTTVDKYKYCGMIRKNSISMGGHRPCMNRSFSR